MASAPCDRFFSQCSPGRCRSVCASISPILRSTCRRGGKQTGTDATGVKTGQNGSSPWQSDCPWGKGARSHLFRGYVVSLFDKFDGKTSEHQVGGTSFLPHEFFWRDASMAACLFVASGPLPAKKRWRAESLDILSQGSSSTKEQRRPARSFVW